MELTKKEAAVLQAAAEYASVLRSLKMGDAPIEGYNKAMMKLLEAAAKLDY